MPMYASNCPIVCVYVIVLVIVQDFMTRVQSQKQNYANNLK